MRARLASLILLLAATASLSAQVRAPRVDYTPIPANADPFGLSFDDFKKYSSTRNFEPLGQSYFKVPERTDWAKGIGRAGPDVGSGFNTVRVYDGIAYLAGYNAPLTIPGFMAAMEMSFAVASPSLLGGVKPGARIQFTIDAARSAITAIDVVQAAP